MPGKKSFRSDHPDPVVRELERVRERLGCSQQRMADALGVPFRTYQKWVSSDQKPRHGAALLGRAQDLTSARRANCWEVRKCGREPGGSRAALEGPCPAAADESATGINGGLNGGRICWAIRGTACGIAFEKSEGANLISCLVCPFFNQVLQEEGLANFRLLKPGQSFTQT